MAILYHFPIFHTLSSPKLSSSFHIPSPYFRLRRHHNYRCSTISASSSNKPSRAIKKSKSKSDEDLRNDIKDFLSSVGLPENHLPTMKELSHHGRQDLANIVRRRGYKFIKQLLEIPSTANFIESNVDTGQTGSKEEDINSCIEADEELQIYDQSCAALTDESLSMQEKVARFIQLGDLDEAEDDALGMTNEEYADEEGKKTELEHSNELGFAFSMSNGNVRSSAVKVDDPALESTISRNSCISTKEHTNTCCEDLDDENVGNQTDTAHLKFLLYKKELELTQLKEEIEKAKLAISLLHSQTENEISKAEELVSEKETELLEAEEALSGLKEVEIQYSGEGETVELAGSFNGWLHKIPMEPQLSSSIVDPTESSTSQVWRIVLWLYPGVYEIKFVVDGDWRVDPEMELITRNDIHNNILRVE